MSKTAQKNEEVASILDEDKRKYELMVILEPEVTEPQYKKNMEAIRALVETHGGTVWHAEEWGKRELAYSIKKKTHGFYVIFDFDGEPLQVPELNNQLRITNFVVRHLIVKLPDNYTPQKYDLDAEPERAERKEVKTEAKLVNVSEEKPREVVQVKPAPEMEKEVKPKKVAKKTEMSAEDSAKELSKLDEKLEELLSSDGDLNL